MTKDSYNWFVAGRRLKNGEPCDHIGCLNHISHPCEGCGRIAGKVIEEEYDPKWSEKVHEENPLKRKVKIRKVY